MTIGKNLALAILLLAAIPLGCGKKDTDAKKSTDSAASSTSSSTSGEVTPEQDSIAIQALLTDVITRWRLGDLSALYDNEFEYLKAKYNFDEYLSFQQIEAAEADTVMALNVKKLKFFRRDSVIADIEVVFKGPTGKISHDKDQYILYFENGHWIRPTVGTIDMQKEYERSRVAADSAAEQEARESGGK